MADIDIDLDLDPGVEEQPLDLPSGWCLPQLALPVLPSPGFPGLPTFDFGFLLDLLNFRPPKLLVDLSLDLQFDALYALAVDLDLEVDLDVDIDFGELSRLLIDFDFGLAGKINGLLDLDLLGFLSLPKLPLPALPMISLPALPDFDFGFLIDLLNFRPPKLLLDLSADLKFDALFALAVNLDLDIDLDMDIGIDELARLLIDVDISLAGKITALLDIDLLAFLSLPKLPLPALPSLGFPLLPSFDFGFLLDLFEMECPRARLAAWLK